MLLIPFHHPSANEEHEKTQTSEKVVVHPDLKTILETHDRNTNKDYKTGCEPEVEHDFIVELHVRIIWSKIINPC